MLNFFSLFNQNPKIEETKAKETSGVDRAFGILSALAGQLQSPKHALLQNDLSGLSITKFVVDYLDEAICNDPIISQAHSVYLNTADTELEIKIETGSKRRDKQVITSLENDFPLLFPGCSSIQDVSKLLMDRALSYGLISFQFQVDEETGAANFVLPPVFSLEWVLEGEQWRLYQTLAGSRRDLTSQNILYKPLMPLKVTNEGRFVIPPFKPALKAALEYQAVREAEVQIAKRTGLQVIFDVAYKVLGLPDWLTKGGAKEEQNAISARIATMFSTMMQYVSNGFILRTDEFDVKPITTVEPPASIQTFDQLLAQRVIAGCKAYAPLIGYSGKENQTTLSSTQLKLVYNFCTSLQDAADHALQKAAWTYLSHQGFLLKSLEIEREKPVLDGLLVHAQASKIHLEIAAMKQRLEASEQQAEQGQQSPADAEASQDKEAINDDEAEAES